MTRVVRLRRESPEIGLGEPAPVEVDDSAVLAHRCDWRGRTVVCVHNLGGRAAGVRLGGFDGPWAQWTGTRAQVGSDVILHIAGGDTTVRPDGTAVTQLLAPRNPPANRGCSRGSRTASRRSGSRPAPGRA